MLPISTDVDFADCCNWHDACYSTCGMKKTTCEKRLDKCMNQKCELIGDAAEKDKCKSTAKLFSLGAQMIACPAFQDAQREACQCVPTEQVDATNKERLVQFLKQSDAPKKELDPAALDKLLAKYSGQEPKMFLRLLLKYPHALKMDKKKTNFMEDIFKAGGADMPSFPKATNREKPKRDAVDDAVDEHIEL
uniref:Phospholipase A2 n=1 Tax=Globisporangium ultimum (strain ATCC 200006 / CBS 805.95 / DAOM BR144) TaxID=431595 RepID=K3W651_GLOUD